MDKFQILFRGKNKTVKGTCVGNYFGVDFRLGKGWLVTHLPSGFLLTDTSFATDEDAIYFAQIAEQTFSEVLASPEKSVILDNRYDVPGGDAFYCLRGRLEDLDGVITKERIDDAIKQIRNIRTKQSQHIGGEAAAQ